MTCPEVNVNPSDEIRKFQSQIDNILATISTASLFSDPATKSEMHVLMKDLELASEKIDVLCNIVDSRATTNDDSIKAE